MRGEGLWIMRIALNIISLSSRRSISAHLNNYVTGD